MCRLVVIAISVGAGPPFVLFPTLPPLAVADLLLDALRPRGLVRCAWPVASSFAEANLALRGIPCDRSWGHWGSPPLALGGTYLPTY